MYGKVFTKGSKSVKELLKRNTEELGLNPQS